MNIVIRYKKNTLSQNSYAKFLFYYRKNDLIKYTKDKNINNSKLSCAGKLPLKSEIKKSINKTCNGTFIPDCDKCWINVLENFDDYIDKSESLPIFLKKEKVKNKPSFLKR